MLTGCIAFLSTSAVVTVAIARGRNNGTVVVSNVFELVRAISYQPGYDTIILSDYGSPYNLGEQPSMSPLGHLALVKGVTLKGSGRTTLVGTTNRILYVKSPGVKLIGLAFENGDCSTATKGTNDSSRTWGGAVYFALPTNECLVSGCLFKNNKARRGGAIAFNRADDPSTSISGSVFIGNECEEHGGAVYQGGILRNCEFTGNKAVKNGGAVYRAALSVGKGTGNTATKGSEFSECDVSQYTYAGDNGDSISRFHNTTFDRCYFSVTNGSLFSGYVRGRSSVIADGVGFNLTRDMEKVEGPVYSWHYDEEGKTNCVSTSSEMLAPSLENCTIVNNRRMSMARYVKSPKTPLSVANCLFHGNTIGSTENIVNVNTNLAFSEPPIYRRIPMTKGQRFVALGWRGEENWTYDRPAGDEIKIDHDRIDDAITLSVVGTGGPRTISSSLRYYYYARGWNGDERIDSFVGKAAKASVGSLSYSKIDGMFDYYSDFTRRQDWYDYYAEMDGNWDGESNTIGSIVEKNYDVGSEFGNMVNFDTSFLKCEEGFSGRLWNCYPGAASGSFSPKFAGSMRPKNPYAIDLTSPANHVHYTRPPYGLSSPEVKWWMLSASDMNGASRLYGGGLDIGAYQATPLYPTIIIFK